MVYVWFVDRHATCKDTDATTLDGKARYRLRYDPESGHLRGTRDGRLFWAAKEEEVRNEVCPMPR